jgi:imidazolonepropionase
MLTTPGLEGVDVRASPASPPLVIRNAAQVVCVSQNGERVKSGPAMRTLNIIADGAVLMHMGDIIYVGPTSGLTCIPPGTEIIDATGKTVLPGFVDSHTHLVFAGSREAEFEQRLEGASYQQIAKRGGGINATVRSVREATPDELKRQTRRRLERLLRFGVTTVEVKSGYGLTPADERKCLELVAELNAEGPWELVPTFLGAHNIPPEYRSDRSGYVRLLTETMLPEIVHGRLADFCDVFCETGAFTVEESDCILRRALDLGFRLKLHADELSPLGGAELATRLGAVSADHLLCVTEAGIDALAGSNTIATLLPGTAFFLGMPYAPARKLIDRGAVVALASDCNPGTCPTENLPLVGAMACTQMRMVPAEAMAALTLNAAAALGRSDRLGSIEVGKQADLVVCDVPNYQHLFYHFGVNHVWRVIKRGRVVYSA